MPSLGRGLHELIGNRSLNSSLSLLDVEPPESYDSLLRCVAYSTPTSCKIIPTPWTCRTLTYEPRTTSALKLQTRTRYKTVDKKVRPVPSYMPDPAGQVFKPVEIEYPEPLTMSPPLLNDFVPTPRLSRKRLDIILSSIPSGFLSLREIDLLVHVLRMHEAALAFDDSERGTFSDKFFPPYVIPVIEHVPWVQPPICIPKAIEHTVRGILEKHKKAGKYEDSSASYRSRIFPVAKKEGRINYDHIRLVQDVQKLNQVTVRDAGLPPRIDDFAEGFVRRTIYGLFDLFSGYDGRSLAIESRPLTTFSSLIGPLHNCTLPQGAINSVCEFQRCVNHTLREEIPENGDAFIDDIGIKGPTSRYGDVCIAPNIRRFLYEYASTVDRFLLRMIVAGITASGFKIVLATSVLEIVGSIVSHDGWRVAHGIVSKISNWGELRDVSDVRSFLGTAGVG